MSRYVLYVENETTEHEVKAGSPAKALRELVALAEVELESQNGRYGRTTDGKFVAALTIPWGRTDERDARTTRFL